METCSADCTIHIAWTQSFGATAYSFEWSTLAETVPDVVIDTVFRFTVSPCLPSGSWYFHVRALNSAQAWSGPSHAGPFHIDISPPTPPTSITSGTHQPDRWSPHASIALALTGASDAECGLDGYSLVFDRSPMTLPDATIDLRAEEVVSDSLGDGGPWYAHVRTFDQAGNTAPEVHHLGPLWIDTAAPAVTLVSPNGGEQLQGGATIPVVFTVDDVLSGVRVSRVEASLDGGVTWSLEIEREVPPARRSPGRCPTSTSRRPGCG